MHIILTHEQADFDAIASLLGAYLVTDGAVPVLPRRMNRNVSAFLTLYGVDLPFSDPRDLPNEAIDQVTLVDTQSLTSIKGMVEDLRVHVVDHHPLREDLPGDWVITVAGTGANTTIFVETLRERDIVLTTVHATLLLLGIYEDTGSLTYDRTTARDLRAAAYLVDQGASVNLAADFMNHPLSEFQQELYDHLRKSIEHFHIHGYTVIVACEDASHVNEELSTVVHKLRDLLDPDGLFVLVSTRGGVQLIARSTTDNIDVAMVAAHFGGGGHDRAAASLIKDRPLGDVRAELIAKLPEMIKPAVTVSQIMSRGPQLIDPDTHVEKVAQRMQRYGYEGYPVVKDGLVVGLVTRRAVDRALAHKLNATAASLMEAGEYTVTPDDSIEYLQRVMTDSGWGQIPVVSPESGEIIGIVTRTDFLKTLAPYERARGRLNLADKLEKVLPSDRLRLLKTVAEMAHEQRSALYIVGGFVRDLLLDRPSLDFDLVVEGDAIRLAKSLARRYGGRVTSHARFGTAKWHIQGSVFNQDDAPESEDGNARQPRLVSLDLVTARTEFYTHPTALPTVEQGSIKLDLHRRDFTINTLALRLDGRHYAELHDYWGGSADLRHGLVRVLHSLSFVDDPTRMLRAVRFEQRFGFKLEKRTEELLKEAIPLLDRVSGDRIRHELDTILLETNVIPMLRRLSQLELLEAIHPDLSWDAWFEQHLEPLSARQNEPGWPASNGDYRHTDVKEMIYILWLLRLSIGQARSVLTRLKIAAHLAKLVLTAHQLWIELPGLAGKPTSQVVNRLDEVPSKALYALSLAVDEPHLQDMLVQYIEKWQHIQPTISGHDLRAQGLRPGPVYKKILKAVRDAWLDGEIQTPSEEAAYLERLLQRHHQQAESMD